MGLYAVGLPATGGGYGTGQRSMLTATVQTVTGGNFSITGDYTCDAGDYVYLTSVGGTSTTVNGMPSGNNSAAALMAALGPCSGLSSSTFITLNEATTVAAVFAMQQFMAVTWGTANTTVVGAPSSNVMGFAECFCCNGEPDGCDVRTDSFGDDEDCVDQRHGG